MAYLFIYLLHRKDVVKRKPSSGTKQKSSKILVRNVPFEATQKELRELFGTFGELKTVRLPKKLSGTGPHRGLHLLISLRNKFIYKVYLQSLYKLRLRRG